MKRIVSILALACTLAVALCGCGKPPANPEGKPASVAPRTGDEIVIAGEYFHTGTRVVLWNDPGGLNGYAPPPKPLSSKEPAIPGFTFGKRNIPAPGSATTAPIELDNPDLSTLRNVIDQFVLHYDGSGVSQRCFSTLEHRGLSVHFMLDLDGTIYQAIDVKERAFHATTSNSRSVGVEIANIGAFPIGKPAPPMDQWYVADPPDSPGAMKLKRIVVPSRPEYPAPVWHNPAFIPRPLRNAPVTGVIQHEALRQYDYTPEQYTALAHLTATLCRVFPKLDCDYPRDASGRLVPERLTASELARYHGVLGHYHIQANKNDPGPAMQWDKMIKEAQGYLSR